MIVFVTTIRHPDNSRDYHRIGSLLERTLNSVCAQSDKNFRVLVVCNKKPNIHFESALVEFIVLENFPAPGKGKADEMDVKDVHLDKGIKYILGCKYALKYHPDYIMFFDSDDFIHKDIANYLNKHKGENGFVINQGYIYRAGGMLICALDSFNERCGSSIILNPKSLKLPKDLDVKMSKAQVLAQCDEKYLNTLGTHNTLARYFNEHNCKLKIYPKQAAIWVLETGENRFGGKFYTNDLLLFYRPVTQSMKKNFGFDTPSSVWLLIKEFKNVYKRNLKYLLRRWFTF